MHDIVIENADKCSGEEARKRRGSALARNFVLRNEGCAYPWQKVERRTLGLVIIALAKIRNHRITMQ